MAQTPAEGGANPTPHGWRRNCSGTSSSPASRVQRSLKSGYLDNHPEHHAAGSPTPEEPRWGQVPDPPQFSYYDLAPHV